MADNVYEVAAQIMKENPKMKSYEALAEAKKIINEKPLSPASKIGTKK